MLRHFLSDDPKHPRKQVKLTTYDGVVEVHTCADHSHKHKLRGFDISELCGSVVCVATTLWQRAWAQMPLSSRQQPTGGTMMCMLTKSKNTRSTSLPAC